MVEPGRILIVDDEKTVRVSLADLLSVGDREVVTAASGEEALEYVQEKPFDLILLDLMMTGIDGLEVLKAIHELAPDTVVILLTAYGSLESAIEAMRYGAMDYLLKPASAAQILEAVERGLARRREDLRRRELVDRIESAVRELKGDASPTVEKPAQTTRFLQARGIIIDLQKHLAMQNGRPLELTPTELRLLSTLIAHADQVMSCQELVRHVQNYETDEHEARSIIRVYIRRLRQKIEPDPSNPRYILNVRGAGYIFVTSD